MKKRYKRKRMGPASKAQREARCKNWAKARVTGALGLENILTNPDSSRLSSAARSEIKFACQHLKWALDGWED